MVENAAPYGGDAFMVLLEGQARIKNSKTGALENVASGEVFVIPKGYDCQWQQNGYLRQFYLLFKHPNEKVPVPPTCEGIINISAVHRSASAQHTDKNIDVNITGDSFVMKTSQPVNKGQHLYQDPSGRFFSGIWQSQAFETQQQAFPRHEFIYIQSGQLVCIDEKNQAHKFSQGDAFFIPRGTLCHWRVDDSVCTFYAVLQAAYSTPL